MFFDDDDDDDVHLVQLCMWFLCSTLYPFVFLFI